MQAFSYGFVSHLILDQTLNQYSFNYFSKEEINENIGYVFIDAGFSFIQIRDILNSKDKKRLYGAIGSMTPDILAAIEMLTDNKEGWNKGKSLFHKNKLTKFETIFVISLLSVSW